MLAIDRDDDFGKKAGVRGPVIGRDACIDAALKLSLADPEDSDANVLYAAVKSVSYTHLTLPTKRIV